MCSQKIEERKTRKVCIWRRKTYGRWRGKRIALKKISLWSSSSLMRLLARAQTINYQHKLHMYRLLMNVWTMNCTCNLYISCIVHLNVSFACRDFIIKFYYVNCYDNDSFWLLCAFFVFSTYYWSINDIPIPIFGLKWSPSLNRNSFSCPQFS